MAEQKIKTGVAAFGMSGSVFHAPFLDLHEGFELCTVVERSKNRLRQHYPYVKTVRSFDELLADPELELIVVNTPHPTHYEYCKAALLAGKNVVVEKLFVFDPAQGEELKALAEKQGALLTVYQNRRWDSDFLTVRKVLDSGLLGRVVEFYSAYQRYRPVNPTTWKEKAEGRTGVTYDLGSHIVDQIVQLFGRPQGVWATVGKMRDGGQIDDYFNMRLIYPDVQVTARAGFVMREETSRFTIHGTAGSFVKYGLDVQEEALKRGEKPGSPGWGAEPESQWGVLNTEANGVHFRGKVESVPGNYMAYYDAVYETLRHGAAPTVGLDGVLDTLRVLDAAFRSSETRQVVWL